MNGEGREVRGERPDDFSDHLPPLAPCPLPLALSCLALLASFGALLQIDIPLARFFRAVHVLRLEQVGDIGDKIGSGYGLATISVAALVMWWVFKNETARQIGVQSAVAHGVVALLANGLKHLIGRPRPRFTHAGGFQFWPSWDSGLDSFPSGHTSASFAVATVLARHGPRGSVAFYGIASWIAASRVWRGSHFPTDILAGVCLGVTVGMVASRPIREWRDSFRQAVISLTPYMVAVTALLWVACHGAPEGWDALALMVAGAMCLVIGLGTSLLMLRHELWPRLPDRPLARMLIAVGLACTTGSYVVLGLVGLTAFATWIGTSRRVDSCEAGISSRTGARPPVIEGLSAAAVVLAALLIQGLKGVIPIQ